MPQGALHPVRMNSTEALHFIVSLVVPPRCAGCGAEPPGPRMVLCDECRLRLRTLTGQLCLRCALPLPCDPCPAVESGWDQAGACCEHGPVSGGVARALKDSGARSLARFMARMMVAAESFPGQDGFALVPVERHPARLRAAGVDQSLALSREISRLTGRPTVRCLRRVAGRAVERQASASRSTRLEKGRIEFQARHTAPQLCLLIDDVHTTGATLAAASAVLRAAGAETISCMTFARALRHGSNGLVPATW